MSDLTNDYNLTAIERKIICLRNIYNITNSFLVDAESNSKELEFENLFRRRDRLFAIITELDTEINHGLAVGKLNPSDLATLASTIQSVLKLDDSLMLVLQKHRAKIIQQLSNAQTAKRSYASIRSTIPK